MAEEKIKISVSCASGVEKVTKSELKRLGYGDPPAILGGINFSARVSDVGRLNVFLRTADRVYIDLAEFPAKTFDELYSGVTAIPFENYIPKDANIIVDGKCVKSTIYAVSASQSVIKKAIVTRLSDKYKVSYLPETGARYEIDYYIYRDVVTIKLNTSGAGLHKRGYRKKVWIAPIKETLASALILLSDYYKNPFLDPFCGSGTIPIEAALIATDTAPGMMRDFDFLHWKNANDYKYDTAIEEAKDRIKRNNLPPIFASDIDNKAIKLAKEHAELSGVSDLIKFSVCPVDKIDIKEKNLTLVTNPPYGERVYDAADAKKCYEDLGKVCKNREDWSEFIITSDKNFEKKFGKKADRKRKLYNSEKECDLYYFYRKIKENL